MAANESLEASLLLLEGKPRRSLAQKLAQFTEADFLLLLENACDQATQTMFVNCAIKRGIFLALARMAPLHQGRDIGNRRGSYNRSFVGRAEEMHV
mmetsp:Transcript_27072/g.46686  ORF Transcript_27072/g.46686 Transcript_27072/m.46686 type:complete len:96 (+) Transcript_27072:954-1241(+)